MRPLTLSIEAKQAMHAHVRAGYPHEVVGILAGSDAYTVDRVQTLANERTDRPENRYLVSGLALYRASERLEAQGLTVVGYYHSHPDHTAQYSEYDRDHALPNLTYIIVSVNANTVVSTLAWRLRDDRSAMDEQPIIDQESM